MPFIGVSRKGELLKCVLLFNSAADSQLGPAVFGWFITTQELVDRTFQFALLVLCRIHLLLHLAIRTLCVVKHLLFLMHRARSSLVRMHRLFESARLIAGCCSVFVKLAIHLSHRQGFSQAFCLVSQHGSGVAGLIGTTQHFLKFGAL